MSRREPDALLPVPVARLLGFSAFAAVAVVEWARMVEGLSPARALLWVLSAAAAGAAVWACDRLPPRRRRAATPAVAVAALLAAVPAAGVDVGLLRPRHWSELVDGVANGVDRLIAVRLPYTGADPWPALTLQLLGSLLCVLAALLALWPRGRGRGSDRDRGYPFFALVALLVLAAAPVVSLGSRRSILFGGALAVLTVCFLWLERLPLRPGVGVAALLSLALAGALPLAGAADRDTPWFDYKAFAEGVGPQDPVRFDWEHSYGPIAWPRDRRELLSVRVRGPGGPEYWKAATLDAFDGEGWRRSPSEGVGRGDARSDVPPAVSGRPEWTRGFEVSVRRLRSVDVVGPGSILGVSDPPRPVRAAPSAGRWNWASEPQRGESYRVRAYTPRPGREALAVSSAGAGGRHAEDLEVRVPFRADVPTRLLPRGVGGAVANAATVRFPAFGDGGTPRSSYPGLGRAGPDDGLAALHRSAYARTWRLARRLRHGARTPYEYLVTIDRYLHGPRFTYSERAAGTAYGVAPLDGFLLDTHQGYCQHYSGAMALLLRMGGVPARVASGFSPGGYSARRGEWIVRDTDAHSWVEAWFDSFGWVTFDPTPGETPARSQIAALPAAERRSASPTASPGRPAGSRSAIRRDLLRDVASPGLSAGRGRAGGARHDGGGALGLAVGLWLLVAVLGVMGMAAWATRRARRKLAALTPLDRAVAELESAFRRAGRPAPPGTTLRQLERHFKGSDEAVAYVRALSGARYAADASWPTAGQRRAVRRELAHGLGGVGRLRALWALPPRRRSGGRQRARGSSVVRVTPDAGAR